MTTIATAKELQERAERVDELMDDMSDKQRKLIGPSVALYAVAASLVDAIDANTRELEEIRKAINNLTQCAWERRS